MPGFHGIRVDSQVMLSVVVPPLLYSAALDFSFPTFLRNIRAIVGLVSAWWSSQHSPLRA
jgi:NhaP-type Na+/H+ or K+/H+ antiporter